MAEYNKRAVGSMYEDMAVKYLVSQGHTIIKRNYRTSYGEIDIISKDNSTLVFTECKYRKNSSLWFINRGSRYTKAEKNKPCCAVFLYKVRIYIITMSF